MKYLNHHLRLKSKSFMSNLTKSYEFLLIYLFIYLYRNKTKIIIKLI